MTDLDTANLPATALFWEGRVSELGGKLPRLVLAAGMFERYTEHARRVLFFARYECSELGSPSIESEHLLLGLTRQRGGLIREIFDQSHFPREVIREEIERRYVGRPKVPTSVEIPFSADVKRSLMLAAEESDQLSDTHIGCEHLLLGLLREGTSTAASILTRHGLQLDAVRHQITNIRPGSAGGQIEGAG